MLKLKTLMTLLCKTHNNVINILAKLIRANIGGLTKITRYNPAPSILHRPERSLKDPAYWFIIQHTLNYFTNYKDIMKAFDMSLHESDELTIVDSV